MDHLPCGVYTTPEDVISTCSAAKNADIFETDPRVAEAIEEASLILYYATGRQFGICETTIYPHISGCDGPVMAYDPGIWPVIEVVSVTTNGVVDSTPDIRVDSHRYLVWENGERLWPVNVNTTQDPALAGVDNPIMSVTIRHGIEIPRILSRAARVLACELLSSDLGERCSLPERVTSVSRRGVSMDVASVDDLLDQGRFGIPAVDRAIAVLNPGKLQSPSFAWHPEMPRNRIVRRGTNS